MQLLSKFKLNFRQVCYHKLTQKPAKEKNVKDF